MFFTEPEKVASKQTVTRMYISELLKECSEQLIENRFIYMENKLLVTKCPTKGMFNFNGKATLFQVGF